jgi:hypothetical protein
MGEDLESNQKSAKYLGILKGREEVRKDIRLVQC